jgi:glycosyltransferase involved in cell wall biosynthesis
MRRILFVHDDDPKRPISSFFLQDIALLQNFYEVEVLSLYPYRYRHLGALFDLRVWNAIARNDLLFGWFGSCAPAALIATLMRRPTIIIAGGADVVFVPEIDYGLNPRRRLAYHLYRLGFRIARRVLLFSESSRQDYLRLPGIRPERAETLYLGVDTDHFRPVGEKRPQVLTISYMTEANLRRKGIQTFLEAARLTPEIDYRIAGMILDQASAKKIIETSPRNVTFLGFLDDAGLLQELQRSKVYAQLSYHEGFGMAVAEAMACECVPVVTDRGSLPEVAGDTGLYVQAGDPASAADAFRKAVAAPVTQGQEARQRIIRLFRPEARARALHQAVEEVLAT